MSDRDRDSLLEDLFRQLLDVDESRREPMLAEIGRDEPELADTLRRMLRVADRTRSDPGAGRAAGDAGVRPPAAGDSLGRFVLERPLGRGAMGTVWLAYDRSLDRRLALKLLNPQMLDVASARARFRREARALAALRHPGIASVHEVGESDGRDYLAMEWIDGVAIDEFVRDRAVSIDGVLDLALQMAEALHACHSAGVIHRDLKPSNVLVTADGRVKIVDFGLAKGAERAGSGESVMETLTRTALRTQDGALLGTPDHMSPEQAMANPVDARSDLFSFGVTLYELLAGVNPFRRDGIVATLAAIVKESEPDLTRSAGVPREVAALVHACLAKPADRRPVDAGEVVRRLRGLIESRRNLVRRWSLRGRAWLASIRWRRVAAVALGLAAVLGAVGIARRMGMPEPYRAVAVLPMEHLGEPVPGTEEYGDGLSRTLTTKLSRVDGVRVVPWSDVRHVDPARIDVADLVRTLGVDALLFGRYEVRGPRITIVTELIDGRTGLQIGSREYGRPLDEFILLQNEVALETVRQLKGDVTAADRVKLVEGATAEVEAFEFYLRGLERLRNGPAGSDLEARALLENALALDPDLAEAREALAVVLSLGYFSEIYPEADLDRAIEEFRWVLERDPGRVPSLRGLIRALWNRGDDAGIVALIEESPDDTLDPVDRWLVVGDGLLFAGLEADALRAYREVLAIDPTHESALWQGVVAAAWAGDLASTRALSDAYFDAHGRDVEVLTWRAVGECLDGDRELAESLAQEIARRSRDGFVRPGILTMAAEVFQRAGRPDVADEVLIEVIDAGEARLANRAPNARNLVTLAGAYALIGDLDGVDEYLGRAEAITDSPSLLGTDGAAVEAAAGRLDRFVARSTRCMDAGYIPTGAFIEARLVSPSGMTSQGAPETIRRRQRMADERRKRLADRGVIPSSWLPGANGPDPG